MSTPFMETLWCYSCAHYLGLRYVDDQYSRQEFTCKAFPLGIPQEILVEGFDHRKPYLGDHGIRYQPKKLS